jgi:VWFA-related protein
VRVACAGILLYWFTLATIQEHSSSGTGQGFPPFETRVELVTLDIVVTDRDGRPVTGLTAADFKVTEDGRPQAIIQFRAIGQAVTSEPSVSGSTDSPSSLSPPATFAILFDDVHIEPVKTDLALTAIGKFVANGAIATDTLVLLTAADGLKAISHNASDRIPLLDALERLQGHKIVDPCQRMSEFDAMRAAERGTTEGSVSRTSRFAEKSACPGGSTMDAEAIHHDSLRRDAQTLKTLTQTLSMFEESTGKLTVVLVSGGFIDDPAFRQEVRSVLRATLRVHAVLHFLDVRGLVGFFEAEKMGGAIAVAEETGGSVKLAEETGGLYVHDTNDLATPLRRIGEQGRSYYRVGYVPDEISKGERFRRIRVRVDRHALKARYRPGYFR